MPFHAPPLVPFRPNIRAASEEAPVDRSVLGEWLAGDNARIDSMLAEFRDSIIAEHANLRAALSEGDIAECGMAVHRIRGAALSMGAKPLARAAAAMDVAARAKDIAGCRAGIDALEWQLGQMLANVPRRSVR